MTPAPFSGPVHAGRLGRLAHPARIAITSGLFGLIFLGLLGQLVRDRSIAWALLMDLPLPLLGGAVVGFDLLCRGWAVRWARHRFALLIVGLVVAASASLQLISPAGPSLNRDPAAATPQGRPISVLHWNVVWGGGRRRNPGRWAEIRRTIAAHRADVIVLSEAAPDDWLDELVADLGPGGARVQVENGPGARHWFKLVVAAAHPVRLLGQPRVRNGEAIVVEVAPVDGQGSPTRLLVVDGLSHPLIDRTPFLHDVARLCRAAEAAGSPYDLVLGDFNSMSRSLGFDALAAAGYRLASRSAWGWRGTFPSFAPVYDIDHVWVRRGRWAGVEWDGFTDLASDHRGQVVTLRPPAAPAAGGRRPAAPPQLSAKQTQRGFALKL